MTLLLTACIGVPIASTEPYKDEVVASIEAGMSSQRDVEALLGHPPIRLANNQLWIYGEARKLFCGFAYDFSAGCIEDFQSLVISFEQGTVSSVELIEEANGCTKSGICHRGGWYERDENGQITEVDNLSHRSTVVYREQQGNVQPMPVQTTSDKCTMYIYSNADVYFHVDSLHPTGIDRWAYARYVLDGGTQSITIHTHGDERISDTFSCDSGSIVFVQISVHIEGNWPFKQKFEYVFQVIDSAEGHKQVAGRKKVILP